MNYFRELRLSSERKQLFKTPLEELKDRCDCISLRSLDSKLLFEECEGMRGIALLFLTPSIFKKGLLDVIP
jgi:hypothetical protein